MSNSIPGAPSPIDFNVLLAEFDTSGLSAAAFARSKGLASWRIYYALQRRSSQARSHRVTARAEHTALLPVRIVDAKQPAAIELLLVGGHRLLISSAFDAPTLRRLLGVLAQC